MGMIDRQLINLRHKSSRWIDESTQLVGQFSSVIRAQVAGANTSLIKLIHT